MTRATVTGSAADFIPPRPTLPKLREAAAGCRGCDLWLDATQTVFGEGSSHAVAMFVGEQPGDQEDRVGRPFVGPAGRLFDEALETAGIDRGLVYVTNAVKHFKFVRQELVKRRLHKKPNAAQVRACNPWLREEIRVVGPRVVVAMGSTAAQALLGNAFRVTRHRGEVVRSEWAGDVIATVHPSAVLRAPGEFREEARREFFRDITKVAEHIRSTASAPPARISSARSSPPGSTMPKPTRGPTRAATSRPKKTPARRRHSGTA